MGEVIHSEYKADALSHGQGSVPMSRCKAGSLSGWTTRDGGGGVDQLPSETAYARLKSKGVIDSGWRETTVVAEVFWTGTAKTRWSEGSAHQP